MSPGKLLACRQQPGGRRPGFCGVSTCKWKTARAREEESNSKAQRVLLDCRSSADRQIFQQPKRQLYGEAGVSRASSSGQWAISSSKVLLPGSICAVETLLSPVLHRDTWFHPGFLIPHPGARNLRLGSLLHLKSSSFPALGGLTYGSDFTEKNPFVILS